MKFTKAYQYDKDSKEYLNQTKIQQNPLVSGQWLFPPCTVLRQPLTKIQTKAVVWDQELKNWKYIDDHRGEFLYNKDDSRITIQISTLQYQIPSGYTDVVPPDTKQWYKFKNKKWTIYYPPATKDQLYKLTYEEKCKVAYGSIFITKDGKVYEFLIDKDSMATITNQAMAFAILGQTSTVWKVYQNGQPTMIELTKEQFTQIYAHGKEVVQAAFSLEGTFNAQIKQFTDQQLGDHNYITTFKETVKTAFEAINRRFTF